MKKTVLFLMNGFGIEQKDSYNIYDPKITPNLDSYTQKYLFSTIESNTYNTIEGYRLFSTGTSEPLTYTLINSYMEQFEKNQNLNFYLGQIEKDSKVQIYLFLENEKSLVQLKNFLKYIRSQHDNNIYLHLVLTSLDIDNYKNLEKFISRINYDYKDCKIATIIGYNELRNASDSYMNMLKNHVGEKWRELGRKFISLTNSKIAPCDMKEFYVNEGFDIDVKDTYFFFNYTFADVTNFVTKVNKHTNCVKYFSMFPANGIKYSMFAYPISAKSITSSLKECGSKGIILTDGRLMPSINYYANGLKNVIPENFSYVRTEGNILFDQNRIKALITGSDYDLIILDYQVDNVKTIDELKDRFVKLDYILKHVHDTCVESGISLFISSLYGMKKEIQVDNYTKAFVNLSSKVPFIVIDPMYSKENFRLETGMNVANLANTVYSNINSKYNGGEVIIKKISSLAKAFKK